MFLLENIGVFFASLLTGSVVYVLVNMVVWIVDVRKRGKAVDRFPMNPKHWFWGHANIFPGANERGLAYHRDATEKFPRVMGHYMGNFIRPSIGVHHPETTKIVLKTSEPKPAIYRFGEPWIGDGLILSGGEKWFRNRRLLTPAFHYDVLKQYIITKNEAIDIFMAKLEKTVAEGESFEFFSNILLLTFDIILRCSFSYQDNVQIIGKDHPYVQAVLVLGDLWIKRVLTPHHALDFIYRFTDDYKRFEKDCKFVHSISEDVIKKRRSFLENLPDKVKQNWKAKDLLDILLMAKDDTGQTLSDLDIRNEVDTFLFAGHDTTGSSISWTLYSLACNQQYQQLCQQEIDSVYAEKTDKTDNISWDDLSSKFTYLTRCIKESMRINPPVPFIGRQLSKPLTIDGILMPVGSLIDVNIYNLHQNPAIWENPSLFDPDRFLPENIDKLDSFAFVPFSAGPRNCIGQNFALNEIKMAIARILHKYTITLDPNFEVKRTFGLVMKTETGMYMKAEKRKTILKETI